MSGGLAVPTIQSVYLETFLQTQFMIYAIKASWRSPRENVSYSPLLMSIISYNHLSRASLALFQSHSAFFYFSVIRDPDLTQYFVEKAEEPETKLPTSAGSGKRQESSRKTCASLTTLKPLIVWITKKCGKFSDKWEIGRAH